MIVTSYPLRAADGPPTVFLCQCDACVYVRKAHESQRWDEPFHCWDAPKLAGEPIPELAEVRS